MMSTPQVCVCIDPGSQADPLSDWVQAVRERADRNIGLPRFTFIDFGHARLRYKKETDFEWRLAKYVANEEDGLACPILEELGRSRRRTCMWHGAKCKSSMPRLDDPRFQENSSERRRGYSHAELLFAPADPLFPAIHAGAQQPEEAGEPVMTTTLQQLLAQYAASQGDETTQLGPKLPPHYPELWQYTLKWKWPSPLDSLQRFLSDKMDLFGLCGQRYPMKLDQISESWQREYLLDRLPHAW